MVWGRFRWVLRVVLVGRPVRRWFRVERLGLGPASAKHLEEDWVLGGRRMLGGVGCQDPQVARLLMVE